MWLVILVVFFFVALGGGYWGQQEPRQWGVYGWSPAGLIVLVLVLLWATGNLHGCPVPR